jgi:hypothetical protein
VTPSAARVLRAPTTLAAGHVLALAAAWTADVAPDGASWFGVRGPRCPVALCLGPLACPGCGLVRGVAAAVQGDLAGAFTAHPGAPLVALLLLAATVLHVGALRARTVRRWHARARCAGRVALLAAILGGWLLRALLPSP